MPGIDGDGGCWRRTRRGRGGGGGGSAGGTGGAAGGGGASGGGGGAITMTSTLLVSIAKRWRKLLSKKADGSAERAARPASTSAALVKKGLKVTRASTTTEPGYAPVTMTSDASTPAALAMMPCEGPKGAAAADEETVNSLVEMRTPETVILIVYATHSLCLSNLTKP